MAKSNTPTSAIGERYAASLFELAAEDNAVAQVEADLSAFESLLGGLVVRMGSRQIDTSLKTKLNSLKLALKEVG